MKYKNLLLLSAFWAFLMPTLEGKNLLACPYDPRTELADTEKRYTSSRHHHDPKKIRRQVLKSVDYERMHPRVREWVDKYKDNYRYLNARDNLIYIDNDAGIRVIVSGDRIYLNRTRYSGEDAAWEYQKEPAINPETGHPWIELTAKELKTCMRGGKAMSEEDQQFLKDVLSIINENFHYFYGMKFVDLGRDKNLNKELLVGKFLPHKIFLFGEHVDNFDLTDYSDQQVEIYRALGHPIYSYEGLINTKRVYPGCSNCAGLGIHTIWLNTHYNIQALTFHNVCPEEIKPSTGARQSQTHKVPEMFTLMMDGFKDLIEKKGGNAQSFSMNKTALNKALFLIYQKTKKYTDVVITHEYVTTGKKANSFGVGVNRLSDVIPLSGKNGKIRKGRKSFRSLPRKTTNNNHWHKTSMRNRERD